MKSRSFWSRIAGRGGGRGGRQRLRLQPLGLSDEQLRQLRALCARIGETLDMWVELDARHGEIVLADPEFARRTPSQQLARLVDARPLVTCDLTPPADPAVSALLLFERRQRELLAQLVALPAVRGRSPQFGASGWDPSVRDSAFLPSGFDDAAAVPEAAPFSVAQQRLVTWLLRGLTDPAIRPLTLDYGPDAVIRIDFAQSYALVDPLAQQALRVRREIPTIAEQGTPGADAIGRDLDELVWDIGIAFGALRFLDQPADWWHTPLSTCAGPGVQRYTRLPRHLALASVLFGDRVTLAQMQERTGQSVQEMRPFLQACLFLGLAWWSPAA